MELMNKLRVLKYILQNIIVFLIVYATFVLFPPKQTETDLVTLFMVLLVMGMIPLFEELIFRIGIKMKTGKKFKL